MNPFKPSAAYHRFQEARDKSAVQQRGFKAREDAKNRRALERMPDQRSILVYFHPDAQKESGPELEKYAQIRSVGGYMHERAKGEFESSTPSPKTREQLCENIFNCSPWDAEPLLLDDLNEAKQQGSPEHVNHVREIIRAVSWGSIHQPRTDRPTAAKIAFEFQEEAEQNHLKHRRLSGAKQTKLSIVDPDVIGMDDVVAVLTDKNQRDKMEKATSYIEERMELAWREFIKIFNESKASAWPEKKKYWPGIGVKLPPDVKSAADRVVKLRQIRNQLYFQELYPVLAEHTWDEASA